MDARTDSYLAHQHAQATTGPKLVQFDPTFELLPDELVWILDEVLRLEVRPREDARPRKDRELTGVCRRLPTLTAIHLFRRS